MTSGLEGELLRVAGDPCTTNLSLLTEEVMRWQRQDGIGKIDKKNYRNYTVNFDLSKDYGKRSNTFTKSFPKHYAVWTFSSSILQLRQPRLRDFK